MINYPQKDSAVIAAAQEKYDRANEAVLATEAAIEKLKTGIEAGTAARRSLVEAVAGGETVKPERLHEAAEVVRKLEAELQHHSEVLEIQTATRTAADKGRRDAAALAHAPILHHALRELRDVGIEDMEVQRKMAALAAREHDARQAIMDCFGAGLPMPSAIAPNHNTGGGWQGLPKSKAERLLRQSYGEYALAAFGPPPDELAPAVEGESK